LFELYDTRNWHYGQSTVFMKPPIPKSTCQRSNSK